MQRRKLVRPGLQQQECELESLTKLPALTGKREWIGRDALPALILPDNITSNWAHPAFGRMHLSALAALHFEVAQFVQLST